MAAASRSRTGTLSISVTRWRQWSKAASEPIMLITASGTWRSSGGHVGQPLDLADHVVAEVAHQAAVQRRQLGDHRRPVRRQQVLEHGEDALVAGHVDGQRAVDLDPPVAQQQRGDGIAADEREAAPALAVLDRLEQEARAVADELGVGRDRRLEVGEQLGPHGHDRVRRGPARGTRRGSAGSARVQSAPKRRKKQVRSPVWQAPLPCWWTLNSSTSASQS